MNVLPAAAASGSLASSCPACGTKMKGTKDPQDWVEEMEMLDIMLGDDD